jgi:hypothetical protein
LDWVVGQVSCGIEGGGGVFQGLRDGGQKGFLYTTLPSEDGSCGPGDKEWEAAGSVMPSYLGHFCALLAQGGWDYVG